jgi:GNAT superfamily N-acetyltransferase
MEDVANDDQQRRTCLGAEVTEMRMTLIRQATVLDIDMIVPLMDGYRQFYRQPSEPERIRKFLLDRFEHNQSIIFLAINDNEGVGFTQLYPSFSSGALARIYVLNDLYVDLRFRQTGVGSALLKAAADYGRRVGALRLALSTEVTNAAAEALYEKSGWKKNVEFCSYQLTL